MSDGAMALMVFFNLFANATFSFLAGLLVVSFFIWLFRIPAGSWKLFLLSLPFVKIVFDCIRGVPRDSILLAGSVSKIRSEHEPDLTAPDAATSH